jgi:RsiW-degrading membrane proteinase PrsW (M82 family)
MQITDGGWLIADSFDSMGAWLRRFGTTAAAVLLGGTLSIAFARAGVQLVLDGLDPSRIDLETRSAAVRLGVPSGVRDMGVMSTMSGTVILFFALVATIALIGVALRRQGFREAALGVFVAFAIVMIPLGISGQVAEPPAENAMIGLLVGIVSGLVVVLLAVPATSLTFDQAELNRRRRQAGNSS